MNINHAINLSVVKNKEEITICADYKNIEYGMNVRNVLVTKNSNKKNDHHNLKKWGFQKYPVC